MERNAHDSDESPSKAAVARRLRDVREERFGESGAGVLAQRLGIPVATWHNYEAAVIMPAHVLLAFLEITQADSHWLWTGQGEKYRR